VRVHVFVCQVLTFLFVKYLLEVAQNIGDHLEDRCARTFVCARAQPTSISIVGKTYM